MIRRLLASYTPRPDVEQVLADATTRSDENIEVSVSVLSDRQSRAWFGVTMARRGLQPVWLRIRNRRPRALRLDRVRIDPHYYTPLEAARLCHFSTARRLLGFGLLSWLYLPLLPLVLLRVAGARRANARMDAFFKSHGFPSHPLLPQTETEGFVFTTLDEGNKQIFVRLIGESRTHEFEFSLELPGLDITGADRESGNDDDDDLDAEELRRWLEQQPRATGNKRGTREGDPLNLAVVGEREEILACFGGRWDLAESITLATCVKTLKAFLLESEYRYAPVSPLYLHGRQQDLALQRARRQINERLHLRLWRTGRTHEGRRVWIGQVSRDIGVRFTPRTWNLTTHKIDPDVDEARDYVLDDLLAAERVAGAAYVGGVDSAPTDSPRRNLTGDPYLTDGLRAVILLSLQRRQPEYFDWQAVSRHPERTEAAS